MPFLLSQMIEAYRWIGALIVISTHATNIFVNLGDIMTAPHAAPVYCWWFFASFSLGHPLVLGFFVLSGYLVGGAVLSSVRKEKDFLREYLIHRFARIYIVTIPTLVLTFALDSIGRSLPNPSFYEIPAFKAHFTLPVFLANVVNVQEILAPTFGTNGPLWSLACEFWYYICFPLLVLPLARNYSAIFRWAGFALGAAIFVYLVMASQWFRFGFLLWVMGALATLPRRPLIASRWFALASYVATLAVIRLVIRGPLVENHPWIQDVSDLFASVMLCNLLLTVRWSPETGWNALRPRFHHTFADFSFSLYSIHMPILILYHALADSLMGPAWLQALPTQAHWWLLFAVIGSIILVSYGFSRLTEAHTGAARRFLSASLPRLVLATSRPQELQS